MSNEHLQLIIQSPFVKEEDEEEGIVWRFKVIDPETGKLFTSSISPYALFHSLGETSGETDLLVCSCSVAGCAGLFHEEFECTDKYVHWSLTEYGQPYSWYFDRIAYETGAIKMLHEVYVSQKGWSFNALEYYSYDDFKYDVDDFLAGKPRLKAIWDEETLCEITRGMFK